MQQGLLCPPNAMQRRTAWLVRERRRVGNWSGTGAGKTLAAILASRVCQARLTLVITNYATIEGWRQQILAAYPDSEVLDEVPATCAPHSYLVLNYEQFQTRARHLLVDELAALGPDLLVFDEVQLVKQRDARASLRRQALETLVERLAERNPDLRVLGMSSDQFTARVSAVLQQRTLLSTGGVALAFRVHGHWVYRISSREQRALQRQIAGLPREQALRLLSHSPGVGQASIDQAVPWFPLPSDPQRIAIVPLAAEG